MGENIPQNLEKEVTQVIADVIGRNADELKLDANFWKDLGVDSIKAIEITVAIEKKYKVRIRDEEIPKIATIGQAIQVLKEALKKQSNV
jgi:acyl carrier protein